MKRPISFKKKFMLTKDRKWSAQFEHTILVTETGFDILTLRNEEKTN